MCLISYTIAAINGTTTMNSNVSFQLLINITANRNEITKLTATEDPNYLGVFTGGIAGGVMTFGGMTGDMVGSFIKRRSGIPRGKTFVFLDQRCVLCIYL